MLSQEIHYLCLSSPLADRFGSLNLNDDHTVYTGSTH
jgi:hypothetical protein